MAQRKPRAKPAPKKSAPKPKRGPARGAKPKKPTGKPKPKRGPSRNTNGKKPGSPNTGSGSSGRVTVLIIEGKYSYMKKETAEFFGFRAVSDATGPSGKPVRGSFRGGAIKAISSGGTKSIPIPSGVGFADIKTFLLTAKSNKPTDFITKDGIKWPLSQNNGKK